MHPFNFHFFVDGFVLYNTESRKIVKDKQDFWEKGSGNISINNKCVKVLVDLEMLFD